MPEERPRHWVARQALAISPQALSALLEAKHHEDDLRMAAELREATVRVTHLEAMRARIRRVTDFYELGRLLLAETRTILGIPAGTIALIGDDNFLEIIASSEALIPAYRSEFLEETFIAGEPLRVDTQLDGLRTIGNADVPPETSLRAYPLLEAGRSPFGVIVFEGEPQYGRTVWLPGFVEFCAVALAECRVYAAVESLLIDAALALATNRAKQEARGAAHPQRVSELSQRLARALGLGASDVKRVGLLAALHELSATEVESAWLQVRHGRETSKAWQALVKRPLTGEIYASPIDDMKELLVLLNEYSPGKPLTSADVSQLHLFNRITHTADTFEHLRLESLESDKQDADAQQLLQAVGRRCDPEIVSILGHLFGKPATY
jgi:HD-GYP domain-containing protein (c-di-GMP phosphodiesterase class II)